MGFYGNATYYLPNGTAKYIEKNAVTAEAINEKAVTTEKIADNSITELKIYSEAVTADKIAIEAIQGLNGNRLDKDANDNLQRPSHIAKQTICGEYHPDKNASFEGDIALNTITGGENGNLALNTIDSYNIASGGINDDCLENDYVFFEAYTQVDSGETLRAYLETIKKPEQAIFTYLNILEDIKDNHGNILSEGFWTVIQMGKENSSDTTSWLMFNATKFDQLLIETSMNKWKISSDRSLLIHDYEGHTVTTSNQWKEFMQSKAYKNKNLISSIRFDIIDDDLDKFKLYIDSDTLANDSTAIMNGDYMGFHFSLNSYYLMDRKGTIITYQDDKFIIVSALPDEPIPIEKLEKPCLYIYDLGTCETMQDLKEKLTSATFDSNTVFTFKIAQMDSQFSSTIMENVLYYAVPLLQGGGKKYWQISQNLLPSVGYSYELTFVSDTETTLKFREIGTNAISDGAITTDRIHQGAVTPEKLDRSYRQISYFQKNRYDSLKELLLEVTEGFIENNLEPLDFYSKDQIDTPWGEGLKVEIRYLGQQIVPSNPLYGHMWQLNVFMGTKPKINSIYMVNSEMENGIVSLKGGITQITEAVQGRYGVCSSVEDIVSKLMMQQGLADISYRNMFESSVIIIKTLQEAADWNSGNNQNIEITAPSPGTYTVYYIPAQERFYLQGLDIKKQYYIYYETGTRYYTVEVV